MTASLSVVVPAFNEERRLPRFLDSIREYARGLRGVTCEVIVVDDGSEDATAVRVGEMAAQWPELRLLALGKNRGKGAALRAGVEEARGERVLIADADGAAAIGEEHALRRACEDGADIAVGSRFVASAVVQRTRLRDLSGQAFAWAASAAFGLPVRDTQCGFKMFGRDVGRELFGRCREDGYLIDLEVLLHARRMGLTVVEVPVAWRDVAGSKVRMFRDGLRMARGLWRLRRRFRELDAFAMPAAAHAMSGGRCDDQTAVSPL